jgi:hypothetical protein
VSASKVISLVELFKTVEILKEDLFLTDIVFLDQFIQYVNDQNLLEPIKKQILTPEGLRALELMIKNRARAVEIPNSTFLSLNIAPHMKEAKVQTSQLQELLDHHFVKNITIKSVDEIFIEFESQRSLFLYRTHSLFHAIDRLNEQKRKG